MKEYTFDMTTEELEEVVSPFKTIWYNASIDDLITVSSTYPFHSTLLVLETDIGIKLSLTVNSDYKYIGVL